MLITLGIMLKGHKPYFIYHTLTKMYDVETILNPHFTDQKMEAQYN